jgi:glucose/arabinose dehydrogenase
VRGDEDGSMHVLPRTRRSKVIASVLVVAVLLAAWINRDALTFAAKLAVPGPAYSQAADRTSVPAPSGPDLSLPAPRRADQPTGDDPDLSLGAPIALPGASALADAAGPGPVLVTTLDGRVHSVDLDARQTDVVLDISDDVSTGGERGLLGIAIDPEGERMYLDYTDPRGDTEIRSWVLGSDGLPKPGEGLLHLEIGQPFENHNGGNLVFGPDGALWIGTGDGGGAGDRGEVAQDDSSLLGKMLRVIPDVDGGVQAPTSNGDWERPEIWAIGLRNPWRYSFDRGTDRLWIADVGQNTIEEVDVVDGDAAQPNFGWDTVEGANDYEGKPLPEFTKPVVTYDHDSGCSITGGYVYRGEAIPGLYGWYLYGDYCTGFVAAVPSDEPTTTPTTLAQRVGEVVSFGQLDDGELVLLTADGLHRIEPPTR